MEETKAQVRGSGMVLRKLQENGEECEGGALVIILVVERSEAGACYVNDGTTACKLVAPLSLSVASVAVGQCSQLVVTTVPYWLVVTVAPTGMISSCHGSFCRPGRALDQPQTASSAPIWPDSNDQARHSPSTQSYSGTLLQ